MVRRWPATAEKPPRVALVAGVNPAWKTDRRRRYSVTTSLFAMVAMTARRFMSMLTLMARTNPSAIPKLMPFVWKLPDARLHGTADPPDRT